MMDRSDPARWNHRWGRELLSACLQSGIDHFFVAPGSRSTPLTLCLSALSPEHVVTHYDERGLAYACLGFGRATGRAGVFVCTSGTAVANALPAVVEASRDNVPLLLLTADRPPELRAAGANQAIDQVGIFGNYPVWSFDLPCPTGDVPLNFVRATAMHACQQSHRGPVHLNCMYREPFLNEAVEFEPIHELSSSARCAETVDVPRNAPPLELTGGATIVIAGGGPPEQSRSARALATRLNAVFLSDITSSLHERAWDPALVTTALPAAETVIHLGGRIVSRNWFRFLAANPPRDNVHLHRFDQRIDPELLGPRRYSLASPAQLDQIRLQRPCPNSFRQRWDDTLQAMNQAIAELLSVSDALTEPAIARAIGDALPSGHALYLGNSMPIRDFDQFATWDIERDILVGANRGASGIDGLVASAVGFAIGSRRPTTVVLGDLAFLHDVNSLQLVRQSPVPINVVVINNNGGGIFHFLPIADGPGDFERLFAMPHGLKDFSHAAAQFAIEYHSARTMPEFRREYQSMLESGGSHIIELQTDRVRNAEYHRWLRTEIKAREFGATE